MINFNRISLILLLSIGLLSIDACRKKFAATAEDMVDYGWVLYETNDYLNSNTWFQDAVIDDSE